ncbi:MAG: flippase-like domain-containing protein [Pirellulales bacterium]|nr:flippase-like domain-containing protein [Pirellulales bacterium]
MRKVVVGLAKVSVSIAIVVWLFWDALSDDPEAVSRLSAGEKNWWVLVVAGAACSTAIGITLVRWYFLVRALGLPFRMKDAFRIGFVGYLFNMAPMGIVGGDLVKALMLAREQHGRRAEAVASIIVDRVVGLYTLFVLATAAIFAAGFWSAADKDVRYVCHAAVVVTAVATLGIAALLGPEAVVGRLVRLVGRAPLAGPPLEKLIVAVRMYRHRLPVLFAAGLMSLAVHSLFSTGIHLIAHSLPGTALSLQQHFVVAPLSAITNIIPLPAGPQEGALKFLYGVLAAAPLKGLVVSLAYRIITLVIAAAGIGYYLTSRREVAAVLQEAEAEEDAVPGRPILVSGPAA